MFELAQSTTPYNINWVTVLPKYLRHNDSSTTQQNSSNDYSFQFYGGEIEALYFRSDNKKLYVYGGRHEILKIIGVCRVNN